MIEIEILNNKLKALYDLENELYNMCVNYIKERLSLLPNNKICFDPSTLICVQCYGCNTITYSRIDCVYLIDDDIYADTEDVKEYEITNAETIDLYNIAKEMSLIIKK